VKYAKTIIKPRNSKEVSKGEKFGSSGGRYVAYIKRTIIKYIKLANTGYFVPILTIHFSQLKKRIKA